MYQQLPSRPSSVYSVAFSFADTESSADMHSAASLASDTTPPTPTPRHSHSHPHSSPHSQSQTPIQQQHPPTIRHTRTLENTAPQIPSLKPKQRPTQTNAIAAPPLLQPVSPAAAPANNTHSIRPDIATTQEVIRPVVFITGCSRGGIGHAMAVQFAKRGCKVYGTVRRLECIQDAQGCIPPGSVGSIDLIPMDVTDAYSIQRAVRAVMLRSGRIDILVNNAGIGLSGGVSETSIDGIRRLFDTNVIGVIQVTQEVVPCMLERGQGGKIVNMGSMLAYVSLPWSGPYCATKSALRAITSSLRMELAPLGIQVSLISAGAVQSNFVENMKKKSSHSPTRAATIFDTLHGNKAKRNETAQIALSGGTETDAFAAQVVLEILKPEVELNMMLGKWWWMVIVFLNLPEWMIEWILKWRFGLFGKIAAAAAAVAATSSVTVEGEKKSQ
ncbi:hypothetical protein HDU78_005666 [Chytriomyces hyalinus]|nr:hypothetical protein HDU78_005666 [Chytriomyces hyalinus]